MASFLTNLKNYWLENSVLNTAIPANTSLYFGLVPENRQTPYGVITIVSNIPTYFTCPSYVSEFNFDINIYDIDAVNAESLANTVAGQLDFQDIDNSTAGIYRTNGPVLLIDTSTPKRMYHVILSYRWAANRQLPQT